MSSLNPEPEHTFSHDDKSWHVEKTLYHRKSGSKKDQDDSELISNSHRATQDVEGPSGSSTSKHDIRHNETSFQDDNAGPGTEKIEVLHANVSQGSSFAQDGGVLLIPAPTKDPKDPINLPMRRKILAIGSLCCFAGLAFSAELILGAMLPVFALQYANINPHILLPLTRHGGFPSDINPLRVLEDLPNAPPIWKTYMLSTLPVLMMGLANLFLIPTAIAVGRRPVLLFCGVVAVSGCLWAGFSRSLDSHLAARCFQALGAGTVEGLVPFIISDMTFAHKRNVAISTIFATQGIIIIAAAVGAPYCVIRLTWRWMYYFIAAVSSVFLAGIFFLLPETRYHRTEAEMRGVPRHDFDLTPRTYRNDIRLQSGPIQWDKGFLALWDSLHTFFYPHILLLTVLNSVMLGALFAATYTIAPALLAQPWSWSVFYLGFCAFPVAVSALGVVVVTGTLADRISNKLASGGQRRPEQQLINIIFPTICGLLGSVLFGLSAGHPNDYPWIVALIGLGLLVFGFLGANTVSAVYMIECYPKLIGSALINIAAVRCIIAFGVSFRMAEWAASFGYFKAMMIYTGSIGGVALLLPLIFIWGPAWRARWPGPDRETEG